MQPVSVSVKQILHLALSFVWCTRCHSWTISPVYTTCQSQSRLDWRVNSCIWILIWILIHITRWPRWVELDSIWTTSAKTTFRVNSTAGTCIVCTPPCEYTCIYIFTWWAQNRRKQCIQGLWLIILPIHGYIDLHDTRIVSDFIEILYAV